MTGATFFGAAAPRPLAIVGLGKIARDQHIPAIAHDNLFRVAATVDPLTSLDGVPAFRSFDELLAGGPKIEAVVLATPPAPRAELARLALAEGLHVMLEKPPGPSVASVEDLGELASRQDRSVFASWHARETSAVDAARAWLAQRSISRTRIEWREDIRVWHPGQDWILAREGFGAFDPGINALSILTQLVDEELEVKGAGLVIPSRRGAPIEARLALATGSGVEVDAWFDMTHGGEPCWTIDFETDGGSLTLADGGSRLIVNGEAVPLSSPLGTYRRLYRHFSALIATGASEVDLGPLRIVEAAWRVGRISKGPAFVF